MAKRKPRLADLKRKSPNQERSKRTVDNIIAAADKILSRDGIESLTIRRIAETAGISLGSLYDYFPNKQAVLYRIYEKRLDLLLQIFDEATSEENPPVSFEAAFDKYLQLARDAKYPTRVDLELWNAIDRDSRLAEMTNHYEEALTERYVTLLRRYGSDWSEAHLRLFAEYAHGIDRVNYKLQAHGPHDVRKTSGGMAAHACLSLAQYCGATKRLASEEGDSQVVSGG